MPGPNVWLTTARLGLRRFTPDDLDWLAELYADPDVTRFLGGTKTRVEIEDLFQARILDYYESRPGLGMWVTVERAGGWRAGLHLLNEIQGESFIQVGFVLARWAWGRGFGTEMAAALLRYGFVDLALPRIVGITSPGNQASQRVLLKIGLHRKGERTFAHPAYASQGPLAWFERDAAGWLADHDRVRPAASGSLPV